MKSHLLVVILLAGAPSLAAQQEKKEPQEKKTEPAKKAPSKPRELRLFANGGYNASGLSFGEAREFTLFLENATLDTEYEGGRGPVLEFGAFYSVYGFRGGGSLGVGGGIELYGSGYDADFRQALPHPFFYRRPREISGNLVDLSYGETAIHLDAVYTRALNPQMSLDLFAGPSFFVTSTEVLADLVVEDVYPYDSVTLQRTEVRKLDDNPVGFNAGASVTYRLTPRIGVGFTARFSRAAVQVTPPGGSAIDFNAGGFRAAGGIRILVIPSPPGAKGK